MINIPSFFTLYSFSLHVTNFLNYFSFILFWNKDSVFTFSVYTLEFPIFLNPLVAIYIISFLKLYFNRALKIKVTFNFNLILNHKTTVKTIDHLIQIKTNPYLMPSMNFFFYLKYIKISKKYWTFYYLEKVSLCNTLFIWLFFISNYNKQTIIN